MEQGSAACLIRGAVRCMRRMCGRETIRNKIELPPTCMSLTICVCLPPNTPRQWKLASVLWQAMPVQRSELEVTPRPVQGEGAQKGSGRRERALAPFRQKA